MAYAPALTAEQARILAAYIRTGRIAHLYPRKRTISLNGFPALPIREAVDRMRATVNAENQGSM
jgi:hypothetical protein